MERDGYWYVDGPKGVTDKYRKGHEYAFKWNQAQRDRVQVLMAGGLSFDSAFDIVESENDNTT